MTVGGGAELPVVAGVSLSKTHVQIVFMFFTKV